MYCMEEKMKSEKGDSITSDQSRRSRSFSKPSWLLLTIADLDERMKMVALNIPEEDKPDTFGERAETYYRKRPQLLALLQDLYNGYLSLADRYCQTLNKQQHHRQNSTPLMPPLRFDSDEEYSGVVVDIDSDAESSLSYQLPPFPIPITQPKLDADVIVAELVIKTVDYEILADELSVVEKRWGESSRKIELQKSLLEVLESERLILLNENARIGYRVGALLEENRGLASESLFMKRKAAELARCVLKMREDQRVCMLSRKIEDLQAQIYGLEKRNKEYYQQLVKQEEKYSKVKNGAEVTLEDCFQVDEEAGGAVGTVSVADVLMKGPRHGNDGRSGGGGGGGRRVSKWWHRVKNFDMFMCGPHFGSTGC